MCFVKSASILIETGCYLNGMNTRCTLLVCDFRETDILCFMTVVIYFMGLPSWLSGRESNVVDSLASFLVSLSLHFIFLVFNLIKKKNHFWPCKTLMVSSLMGENNYDYFKCVFLRSFVMFEELLKCLIFIHFSLKNLLHTLYLIYVSIFIFLLLILWKSLICILLLIWKKYWLFISCVLNISAVLITYHAGLFMETFSILVFHYLRDNSICFPLSYSEMHVLA